jgi:threonine dehydratase
MFSLPELEAASVVVRRAMPPTPQYAWPLLAARAGCEVWVKHENHTPIGAFKVRGGLVLIDELQRASTPPRGLVTATRGNHGQSLAYAARRAGLKATIFVPHGNSVEKNAAMRGFGAELVQHGRDFDEARIAAEAFARAEGRAWVASFQPALVRGVATYAFELFSAVAGLDTVYVPIGMGSGICGLIRVRDLLGLATEIVGVVSSHAPAVARSFAAGQVVTTERADTLADGMACRVPDPDALAIIRDGASRIVEVDDAAIAAAIRLMHEATHNTAEGAGAAPLAALLQERERQRGRRIAIVLSGGNIDRAVLAPILAG